MWGLFIRGIIVALRSATTAGVSVAAFGRVAFVGLIGNRPLTQLGQQEIRNAFGRIGLEKLTIPISSAGLLNVVRSSGSIL